ncbi:hypothetical protein EXIGLDRAFT_193572 [Exidia glandulosa HHB12029]|uniref:Uncharacterized protein n=1 Tax=Exidia glandulosa HHB12029 TaxID=1314781 RepID=A0A165EWV7_EXIGL|nr:hypothetical protein EXIGLDRAFT_193572 [Exidia glandulosa HHB12029]
MRLAASKLSLTSLGATTCTGYGRITTYVYVRPWIRLVICSIESTKRSSYLTAYRLALSRPAPSPKIMTLPAHARAERRTQRLCNQTFYLGQMAGVVTAKLLCTRGQRASRKDRRPWPSARSFRCTYRSSSMLCYNPYA